MIWFVPEIGEHEFLARGSCGSAVRFRRDEYSANLVKDFRVVEPEDPSFLFGIVNVKDPEIHSGSFRFRELSPSLEGMLGVSDPRPVEIESVKDQRPTLGVEDTAESALSISLAVHVEYVRDVEIARGHEIANVLVNRQQLLLLLNDLA